MSAKPVRLSGPIIPAADVLAELHPDSLVHVMIPAGDLLRAYEAAERRRLRLTSREAKAEYGWEVEDWNRWAREDGKEPMFGAAVPRPHLDGARWNLPREWCEAVYRTRMKISAPPIQAPAEQPISARRGNHGPRSKRREQQQDAPAAAPRRLAAL